MIAPLVEMRMKVEAERNAARRARFSVAMGEAHERLTTFFNILMNDETDVRIEERHIKRAERLLRNIEEIMS